MSASDQVSGQLTYPSGWYDVPNSDQQRFWDGARWADAYRTSPSAAPIYSNGKPYNGMAIASMVLGIVSLVVWYLGIVTGIVGLVLGAISLKDCEPRGTRRGRGMAIAGITCSIIALVLWVAVIVVIAAASSNNQGY